MGLGATEVILVVLVIVLLFGAKKLPELARGSGRALRIFKAETKGLLDDDDDESDKAKTEEQRRIEAQRAEAIRYEQPSSNPETER
jgi:sec-independent protein translocase protein TatA